VFLLGNLLCKLLRSFAANKRLLKRVAIRRKTPAKFVCGAIIGAESPVSNRTE
jgi:hypothetical protein